MSSEEKAPEELDSNQAEPDQQNQPVEAQLADSADVVVEASVVDSGDQNTGELVTDFFKGKKSQIQMAAASVAVPPIGALPPPLAKSMQNLSANGGAVGSLVLGIWCLIGSFITNWSIINGLLGLLLGVWGLTSRKKKMAWIGIALCVIGSLMAMIQIGEIVGEALNAVDESEF